MHRLNVRSLRRAHLDYWVARAVGMDRPCVVIDGFTQPECLVEIDGTVFQHFAPTQNEEQAELIIREAGLRVHQIGTPYGRAWLSTTRRWNCRFISHSWVDAGLRAVVADKFGPTVTDEAYA